MNQDKNKNRPTFIAAGGLFLLAAMGLWIASFIAQDLSLGLKIVLPEAGEEMRSLLVSIFYYLPFLICPVLLWAAKAENPVAALKLNPIRPGDMLRASIVALLSLMAVQNFAVVWNVVVQKLGLNVFMDSYVRPANSSELMLSVVSAAVVAPLGEELLFRGVMLSAWERRGPKAAVLVTGALFAILHGSVLGLPGQFFGGMMMALLVLWSDSLYAGLAFHSVYNAGGVMMNYISSAMPVDAAEEALMQSDLLAYMGGFTSMLVMLANTALMLAFILLVTRRMRARYAIRRAFERLLPGSKEPKTVEELRDLLKYQPEIDDTPMSAGDVIVLMSGIVSCIGLFVMDILLMLGG